MRKLICTVAVLVGLGYLGAAPAHEVSITISTPTPRVRLGQPIALSVQLKNQSGRKLEASRVVGEGQAELDYHVDLLDATRRAVPRTDYGAAANAGHIDIVSQVAVQIRPHQTVTQHTDLAKIFKITQPGTYTVRVGREWPPKSGKMEWSNTLTLTITK